MVTSGAVRGILGQHSRSKHEGRIRRSVARNQQRSGLRSRVRNEKRSSIEGRVETDGDGDGDGGGRVEEGSDVVIMSGA